MFEWLSQNWLTLVVIAAVGLMAFFAVRQLVKDRKKGCSSCGNDCSCCPMHGSCGKK